jgi:uncharacterized protein HemX
MTTLKIKDASNMTIEQLDELYLNYMSKADNTSNSYFDRDVYRQTAYQYKIEKIKREKIN